jgi:hypothetical protein
MPVHPGNSRRPEQSVNPHNFYRSMPKDWEPVSPGIRPECKVSVIDAGGQRWTMLVRARSLFGAIFAYSSKQCCGVANERRYPKLEGETVCEVEAPDGRVFHRTYRQAMNWANRKAERRNQN